MMIRIWRHIKGNTLYTKITLLGLCSAFVTAAVLVTVVVWLSGEYSQQVQNKVDRLINEVLDSIAQGVYHLVEIEDKTVIESIHGNLNVARNILTDMGPVRLGEQEITWNALNQFTGQHTSTTLPVMKIGDVKILPQKDMNEELPVVDAVTRLVGISATIFQVMNEEGDMLRIATTVTNSDGTRAIGTYIPAINPDGSKNAVIDTVMNGETYSGRAYVVNNWYITAYEPLRDNEGCLVGMLYVGILQDSVSERIRQAILKTKVGNSGYVYVIGGKGAERGRYIVSHRGMRDGENIWENQDDEGRLVIQSIIKKTQALEPGELATEYYMWQNPGEQKPRRKAARLIYYEPWDWVIGTSIYEDELQSYQKELLDGRLGTLYTMSLAGVVIMIIVAFLGGVMAWRITRPVRDMTHAAELISKGNWDVTVCANSKDEIGILATAFNLMTAQISDVLDGLQKSEQFLEDIIENIPSMIFVKEASSLRFVRINKAGEALTGYSRQDLMGKNDLDVFSDKDARSFTEKDKQVLRERKLVDIPEEVIHDRHNVLRILHTTKIPICDMNGNPQFLLGISEDITERKQMEEEIMAHRLHLEDLVRQRTTQLINAKEQAEAANQAKSVFLTKMSHELRTPLNAILGYTQIFLKKSMHTDMAKGLLIMQQSGDHLLAMINDILNLAKIEAGKLELNPEALALGSFIDGIMGIIRSRAQAKGLDVFLDIVGTLPDGILADEIRLRQVLLNLLSNAVKFTSRGSITLRVVICTPSDGVSIGDNNNRHVKLRFEVQDTGVGIPEDQMSRLFQPFEQISQSPRWVEGTGLGLAISRQLVQLMGADLAVKSEAEHGSTFWFEVFFPLVDVSTNDQDAQETHKEQFIVGYKGPRRTVLIVDDIESNRAVLADMLQPVGFDIIEAADGHEAVALAEKHHPDLILLDHYMPVLNGFKAAVKMRTFPELKHAVIIAVSASVPEQDIENYLPTGYDEFIPKPVKWSTLSASIGELMKLEWEYAPGHVTGADGDPFAQDSTPLVVPPADIIRELQHLVFLGDLNSLKSAASHLKQDSPQYEVFADQLIYMATQFDDQGILKLLQTTTEEGA